MQDTGDDGRRYAICPQDDVIYISKNREKSLIASRSASLGAHHMVDTPLILASPNTILC